MIRRTSCNGAVFSCLIFSLMMLSSISLENSSVRRCWSRWSANRIQQLTLLRDDDASWWSLETAMPDGPSTIKMFSLERQFRVPVLVRLIKTRLTGVSTHTTNYTQTTACYLNLYSLSQSATRPLVLVWAPYLAHLVAVLMALFVLLLIKLLFVTAVVAIIWPARLVVISK